MERIVRADERHVKRLGWLTARWHFSFADYHDPDNVEWGALRVFNDDLIAPEGGFGTHPHQDMEIISYILDGGLRHRDSMGHDSVVRPGQVQVMSAGTGILHSEHSAAPDETTRLLQIWIRPRTLGLEPRWAQRDFTAADRAGRWLAVASGRVNGTALPIDADATVQVARVAAGESLDYATEPGRRLYLFVATGAVTANGHDLGAGDQSRMLDVAELTVVAGEDAELVLIDLA